jgi:hypothetical protein
MIEYTGYDWTDRGGACPDRFVGDSTALTVILPLISDALGWNPKQWQKHARRLVMMHT